MAKTVSLKSLLNTYHGMRKLNQNLKKYKGLLYGKAIRERGSKSRAKKEKKRKKERIEKRIIEEDNWPRKPLVRNFLNVRTVFSRLTPDTYWTLASKKRRVRTADF